MPRLQRPTCQQSAQPGNQPTLQTNISQLHGQPCWSAVAARLPPFDTVPTAPAAGSLILLSAMNGLIVNIPNSCCSGWCVQSSRRGLRDRLRSECLLRAGEFELSALRSVSRGVLGGERERDLERPLQQQHTVVPQKRQHHFLCSGFL